MRITAPRNFLASLAMCAAVLASAQIRAHPHAWIDVNTTFHFDGRSQLVAIEAHWLYDDLYSAFEVNGRHAITGGSIPAAQLKPLADETVQRLKDWGYFGVLVAGGDRVMLGPLASYTMTFTEGRLGLAMTLNLARPIDPRRTPIRFSMFDPTFFVEITPARNDPVRLAGPAPSGCVSEIERLDPSRLRFVPETTVAAQTIDPATPMASIGATFAEWIVLNCPEPS